MSSGARGWHFQASSFTGNHTFCHSDCSGEVAFAGAVRTDWNAGNFHHLDANFMRKEGNYAW
jgi:hypothetical protein